MSHTFCRHCGATLPPDSRVTRQFCGGTCRTAAHRAHQARAEREARQLVVRLLRTSDPRDLIALQRDAQALLAA